MPITLAQMVRDLRPLLEAAFDGTLATVWAAYTDYSIDTMRMQVTKIEQWDHDKHYGKDYVICIGARDELEAYMKARELIGAD